MGRKVGAVSLDIHMELQAVTPETLPQLQKHTDQPPVSSQAQRPPQEDTRGHTGTHK